MRRFTFPDSLRLASREEFDRVFKNCSSRSSDALFTVLARSTEKDHPRLGLVVSRKAAGNAVARHRLKRRVRESFRLGRHELPAADIVVIARPGIGRRSRNEIDASLALHWGRTAKQCERSSFS